MKPRHCIAPLGALAVGLIAAGAAPAATVTLTQITTGLNRPVFACAPAGDTSRLFVVEKQGKIQIVSLPGGAITGTFLDISPTATNAGDRRVTTLSGTQPGSDERGLLGLAFHPNYASNGFFYVNYINTSGSTVIARFHATSATVADPASFTQLLSFSQPQTNHNGGCLQFGADGMLYDSQGDGGGQGDLHGTNGNGQNLETYLGKILRLNVDIASPYIPSDNPFTSGTNVHRSIWAYGLRNPWRFSFDRLTNDLYIGDVGQDAYEEINFRSAASTGGENYGWRCMEGLHCYTSPSGATCDCASPGNLVLPIREYDHDTGVAVVGGYVYRGSTLPGEYGRYFHAEYATGQVWSLKVVNGVATEVAPRFGSPSVITAFAEDASGEVYLVTGTTTTTGALRKITTSCNSAADINADCSVNGLDIDLLVGALLGENLNDPAALARSDVNHDSQRDGRDVAAWVAAIP